MALTKPSPNMMSLPIGKVDQVIVTSAVQMFYEMTEVSAFRKQVTYLNSGIAYLTWSCDCTHRGINAGSPGTQYPIGLAGRVAYRRVLIGQPMTGVFSYVANSTGAGQVLGVTHHYTTIGRARAPLLIDAGYTYEFTIYLTSHTDAGSMNGVDGAAQLTVNGGANFLQIEYTQGAFTIG